MNESETKHIKNIKNFALQIRKNILEMSVSLTLQLLVPENSTWRPSKSPCAFGP